ncbi:hypothetical protein HDE_11527 [Halotydeus destructor]|nr:hypothetical protein HDE_11527 [Halotydeus destructor]
MKVADFLIYCLKVLWKYTDKVLGVLLYYFGYRRVRITFYGAFLCCGFLLQSYDTGDTHLHTSVTEIKSPVASLRLPVQDLFDSEDPMTVAEIFDKTPPAEEVIGKCGVHFPSYVTFFGKGVTEQYGMTALRWDRYNKVLVKGMFSVTYKIRE